MMVEEGELPQSPDGGNHAELLNLPVVLLSHILSFLHDPDDIAAAVRSCSTLLAAASTTSFELRIIPGSGISRQISEAGRQVGVSTEVVPLQDQLRFVSKHLHGVLSLDLTGTMVRDDEVVGTVSSLPHLQQLILDSCQKLTHGVVEFLARFSQSGKGPAAISMQRCLRLSAAAALELLRSCQNARSRLKTVLLSHLDPVDTSLWQQPLYLAPSPGCAVPTAGSTLRVLALHNCMNLLTADTLVDVALGCPVLEGLFFGGSGWALVHSGSSPEQLNQAIDALLSAVAHFARLRVLELTFHLSDLIRVVRSALQDKGLDVWDLSSAQCVCSLYERAMSSQRVDSLFRTPDWQLALRAATHCSNAQRRTPLHIAALFGERKAVEALLHFGGGVGINSRDTRGASALFLSTEQGHADVVDVLLQKGANMLLRNTAGESPLYIAALRGHTAAVAVMLYYCKLRHDDWQNAEVYGDGWTPLMAAAVADRQSVAKLLLTAAGAKAGCAAEVEMDEARPEEHLELQRNASPGLAGSSTLQRMLASILQARRGGPQPAQLLDARNRYGQTALHIAARRGSLWFVEALLRAGASVGVRDTYDMRAIDVALHHGHMQVVDLLKAVTQAEALPAVHQQPVVQPSQPSQLSVQANNRPAPKPAPKKSAPRRNQSSRPAQQARQVWRPRTQS
eukprot:jgi/Chlat1/6960/Chrsp52S00520